MAGVPAPSTKPAVDKKPAAIPASAAPGAAKTGPAAPPSKSAVAAPAKGAGPKAPAPAATAKGGPKSARIRPPQLDPGPFQKSSSDNTGLILGALGGVIALIVVIIALTSGGGKKPQKSAPVATREAASEEKDWRKKFDTDDNTGYSGATEYDSVDAAPKNANLYMDRNTNKYVDANAVPPMYRARFTDNPEHYVRVKR